ncbi:MULTISPECIES: hypothetical protein [Cupriavidus]
MSGWKLTAALVTKHIGALGDQLAQAIAAFDPETATQVDREQLQAKLREVAQKLAEARRKADAAKRRADVQGALIAKDEKAATILIEKASKGEVDDATLNEFASNLQAMKASLPGLQLDAVDAQALVDTLQEILDTVEQHLAAFDQKAAQAKRNLDQARADEQRAQLRLDNQAELQRLQTGAGGASTGLQALDRVAERARVQADATQTLADIGQKPLDRANAVEQARQIAAGAVPAAGESAAERLRRIAGA